MAKILAELGLPGLIVLGWLVVALMRYLYSIIKHVQQGDSALARMTYGLLAFLAANSLVYVVAHQIFGDVFVLIIIGFCLGFVLSMPRMSMPQAIARPRYQILSQRLVAEGNMPGVAAKRIAPQR